VFINYYYSLLRTRLHKSVGVIVIIIVIIFYAAALNHRHLVRQLNMPSQYLAGRMLIA